MASSVCATLRCTHMYGKYNIWPTKIHHNTYRDFIKKRVLVGCQGFHKFHLFSCYALSRAEGGSVCRQLMSVRFGMWCRIFHMDVVFLAMSCTYPYNRPLQETNISHQTGSLENHRLKSAFQMGYVSSLEGIFCNISILFAISAIVNVHLYFP